MYPDLSYLFHDLLGTARDNWLSIFKTFGFFLLCAFLVAKWLLTLELRRRERIGQLAGEETDRIPGKTVTVWDYVFNAVFGFLLGYKIPYAVANLPTWKRDPTGVLLSGEGFWWTGLLVAAAFVGYYHWIAKQQSAAPAVDTATTVYPSDRVGIITALAAVGGILGAKAFAIAEYFPRFLEDPIGVLFSGDGLAIYGGLIGGFLAVFWYIRRHGIPALPLMDAVAPGLIVAYGVGRIGCQLSGDGDWGIASGPVPQGWGLPDWTYGFDFPHNVLRRGEAIAGCEDLYCQVLPNLHYPTSLYETLMAFTIGGLLWALRKRLTRLPGMLFALYLVLNGIERFCIEFIRVNDRYGFLGVELSQAQFIAIGFMVVGIAMALFVRRVGPQNLAAPN